MNCDNASLLLYAVTDRSWLHGQTLYEQAEQALQGGDVQSLLDALQAQIAG